MLRCRLRAFLNSVRAWSILFRLLFLLLVSFCVSVSDGSPPACSLRPCCFLRVVECRLHERPKDTQQVPLQIRLFSIEDVVADCIVHLQLLALGQLPYSIAEETVERESSHGLMILLHIAHNFMSFK